jgi:L-threonylcarbamoyladenylate synthase
MDTKLWIVDKSVDNFLEIDEAAQLLVENEVVAFPTETVYGLGGNADSDEAVMKIFAAKGRPSDNPLIIHVADKQQIERFVEDIPDNASLLMNAFWPGPLTIILKKRAGVLSEKATAGLSTIAVRMPDHPVALAVIKKCGLPIAAPSANTSGKPSPTSAKHVVDDLSGKIAGILDGGPTGVGLESTVIDCTEIIPVILRPGGITMEQLVSVVGDVIVDPSLANEELKPKSPGMKYRHYAPDAPLHIVDGSRDYIQDLVFHSQQEGLRVGVLTTEEHKPDYQAEVVLACGKREQLETVASSLYETLRAFNEEKIDIIYSEIFPDVGVGQAIMNRLLKAAGNKIIKG